MFGRFADIFGARAALSMSCMASVVYFVLLSVTDSTAMLFIHKLPAVAMHVLPGDVHARNAKLCTVLNDVIMFHVI